MTRVALVYPLFVATLAFLIFLAVAWSWENSLIPAYERLRIGENLPLAGVGFFGRTAQYWLLAPPLVLGVIVGGMWWRSRRVQWRIRSGEVRNWATPGRLLRCGRLSTFAEVLALLIDQRVPLGEAVVLAGEASGDARISNWAANFAARLELGEPPAEIGDARGALPPLLAWRMAAGTRGGELSSIMRRAADEYRREADRLHARLSVSVPLIFAGVIGGGATLLYAFAVLAPWAITMYQLATND
jgi:type II secretory pathway component PulF